MLRTMLFSATPRHAAAVWRAPCVCAQSVICCKAELYGDCVVVV